MIQLLHGIMDGKDYRQLKELITDRSGCESIDVLVTAED